ncbi:unnamed protein product [Triticum turgidum subsp. durum]|uniref:Very-long-chain (3R)-3-hydroxyacyl-CoA dehydratase n=1 Tax=Triticum turgidum subsp. durum TaxID=4567 RepID=A0A9R0S0N0_TRITD|nr:unnamed protein product [Triticum turgidum subsp. durum]
MAAVKRAYLAVYNWAVFFGWAQVLYFAVEALLRSGHEDVYAAVERPLQLAQTAAVLEILHGLVGLVRSPVSATLPQIGSRLFVTWGILWSFPEVRCSSPWCPSPFFLLRAYLILSSVFLALFSCTALQTRTHILVSSLVISWSITEIIRYSFFGTKELFGSAPSSLLWYSSFLVMYPTGISSEVGLIYIALQFIKVRMPNKWNYSFDYFYASILVLLVYVPGSPHMYTYMLGQRKKALAKSKTA